MKCRLAKVGGAALALGLALSVGCAPMAMAATGDICDSGNGISDELKEAAGCKLEDEDTVVDVVVNLINVALGLIGLLAVGVMVYGGAQYTTSAGDAAKATKARNIIIYGLAGLIVALLAFAIVNFVSRSIG